MIELYDDAGEKVAEIRDNRLVSMDGDCLGLLEWERQDPPAGHLRADMASREARFEGGCLIDDRGVVLACSTPEPPRDRPWHERTLMEWAYGRASDPA
jgi:hypothetical protein